ncbi:hypothetical protein [Aeromonas salmonicida]
MNSEELYRDTMGPYFYEFCHRLHALATMYSMTAKTRLYFCRRAGIILNVLFRQFLEVNKITPNYDLYDFPVSRIVVIKAALSENWMWGGHICSIVFKNKTIRYLIDKLLGKQSEINVEKYLSSFDSNILDVLVSPSSVKRWLTADANNETSNSISNYLTRQKEFLSQHFISATNSNAIIVDSGLYGTISEVLSGIYPDVNYISGFVYLSNYNRVNPAPHLYRAYGLMGSAYRASCLVSHSAVLRHWHFIEKILEPDNSESLSEYSSNIPSVILKMNCEQLLVFDFFKEPIAYDITDILERINRVLSHPSRQEVSIIYSSRRVDDVNGEAKHIIINHEMEVSLRKMDKLRRVNYGIIRRALWREGQMVTSYGFLGSTYNGCRYYIAKANSMVLSKIISPVIGVYL